MDTIDRILEQKNEHIKQLEEENKKLREELKHREDFRKNCSDGTW